MSERRWLIVEKSTGMVVARDFTSRGAAHSARCVLFEPDGGDGHPDDDEYGVEPYEGGRDD